MGEEFFDRALGGQSFATTKPGKRSDVIRSKQASGGPKESNGDRNCLRDTGPVF